jgi:hypothetical protein
LYEYITIAKLIKTNYIPGGGIGFKVLLKPCQRGQTFIGMVGYCTKDSMKTWFQCVSKGVSNTVSIFCNQNKFHIFNYNDKLLQELDRGKEEHKAMTMSYDDNKKVSLK